MLLNAIHGSNLGARTLSQSTNDTRATVRSSKKWEALSKKCKALSKNCDKLKRLSCAISVVLGSRYGSTPTPPWVFCTCRSGQPEPPPPRVCPHHTSVRECKAQGAFEALSCRLSREANARHPPDDREQPQCDRNQARPPDR